MATDNISLTDDTTLDDSPSDEVGTEATPRARTKAARTAPVARRRPVGKARSTTAAAAADVDADVEDDAADESSSAAAVSVTGRRSRAVAIVAAAAGVLMLALMGSTAFFGYHYFADDNAADTQAAVSVTDAQAVTTAKDYAIKLSSFDYRDLNKNRESIVAMSTPEFASRYGQMVDALAKIVSDGKGEATAAVSHAALENLKGDTAQVLLFVDQSARNIVTPDGKAQPYRMLVTLKHVDNRWLVDNVETK